MNTSFQNHINGLRAIAVLGVIFFHFQLMGIDSGFVGVDVFFVISGYLMTRILFEKESESSISYFTEFWMARIRRIAPALIVLSIVCLCVFTTILLFPDYKKFLRSNVTANLFLSNYFFSAQSSYFDTEADNNPLLHTWSLSVEWQFYLIYPFIIYTLKRYGFAIRLSVITALIACSYIYCGNLTSTDATGAYFELFPRVWEFLIGAIVYLIASRKTMPSWTQNSPLFLTLSATSILAVFASLITVDKGMFPGWIAAIPVIAAGFIILTGERGITNKTLSIAPLQIVGNLSYSLYLWHWPVYVYFVMAIAVDRPLDLIEKIAALLTSFAIAFASYKLVEQPIRSKNGYWSNVRIIALWIFSIAVSITALAIAQKSTETSYRLPTYLVNAEKALVDKNPRQGECFLDRNQVASEAYKPKLCPIGVKNSTHVQAILWGDSFADAIQPMVDDALIANHLSGVVSSVAGCLPLHKNAYKKEADKNEFSYCDKGVSLKTLQFISSTPSLRYVLISANWIRYDSDVLNRDFVDQLCELKRLNKIPILIGPVPRPNYDVPRQWGRMELKQRKVIEDMTFSRGLTTEAELKFTKLMAATSASCGTVAAIYPSNLLCEGEQCFSVKNGEAVFLDSAHLSTKGAAILRTDLENVLQKELRQ